MELFRAQEEIWHLQSVTGLEKSGSLSVTATQRHPALCVAAREGTAVLDRLPVKTAKTGAVGGRSTEVSCAKNVWNEGWVWACLCPGFKEQLYGCKQRFYRCDSFSSLFLFRMTEELMSGQRMIPGTLGEESCMEGYEEPCASWNLPVKYCSLWALSGKGFLPSFPTNIPGSWGCHCWALMP